jgi:hypothetical protein
MDQQRTCRAEIAMSALPLKADIRPRHRDVSFGPIPEIRAAPNLVQANGGLFNFTKAFTTLLVERFKQGPSWALLMQNP